MAEFSTDGKARSRNSTLSFAQLPGTRQIFLDLLSGKADAFYRRRFDRGDDYVELQRRIMERRFDRLTLVETLRRQNTGYGASEKTLQNIEKLGRPDTLVVITGQQVTLFGGPLYAFYKAALAIKVAESNCRKLNTDVVPVFWMAADDADFAEVAGINLPSRAEQLTQLLYRPASSVDGLPMSEIQLDNNIISLLDQYRQVLPDTEFATGLIAKLRAFYSPGESLVAAFGKYLTWLLGDRGLILVDPSDPVLRHLAAPIFRRELELTGRSSSLVRASNERLTAAGYHLQVTRPEHYTNMFYHDRTRQRIEVDGDGFKIAERRYTPDELTAVVDEQPERFSPNVFLRPVVQSYLFPTLIHFVGPAEAAYLAQIGDLFDLFGPEPPVVYPRFSATIVERRVARLLEKHQLAIVDIMGDLDELINYVMRRTFPDELEGRVESTRHAVKQKLEELIDLLDGNDPGLLATARKSVGKIDFEIGNLGKKVFQAHKKKNQEIRIQLERIAFHLLPGGGLQERSVPVNYYYARYGPEVIDQLYDAVDCNTGVHHLIHLKG